MLVIASLQVSLIFIPGPLTGQHIDLVQHDNNKIHPEGSKNVFITFHWNPSNSCRDISTKVYSGKGLLEDKSLDHTSQSGTLSWNHECVQNFLANPSCRLTDISHWDEGKF